MARNTRLMRISKELAAEIENKQMKYKKLGIDKTYTECSKDLAAELRMKKLNRENTGGLLW